MAGQSGGRGGGQGCAPSCACIVWKKRINVFQKNQKMGAEIVTIL